MDWQVLFYGILTLCAIIACIITFTARKQKPFPEWYAEVERIFLRNGYSLGYIQQLSERPWKDYYDEGMTPHEAFIHYFEGL